MLDAEVARWLLVALCSVALVVAGLVFYGSRLEHHYTKELRSIGGHDSEPEADELPARYHAQVLAQAWVSYYVCLVFAGLGFVLLVGSADGRGPVGAVVTLVVAIFFFIESRKSRGSMLEQARALRGEDDERRREHERARLIAMVSEGDTRDRLVRDLLLHRDAPASEQAASSHRAPSYVVTPE